MSDVFAELDEVMRQERIAKFWHENGTAIIVFVVMTILTTAGISGYKSWDSHTRKTQTEKLLSALNAEDFPANIDLQSMKLRGGLEAIAALQAGSKLVEEGKTEEAIAQYKALAADKKAPEDFRELGTLMKTRLMASQESADTTALIKELEPITERKDSPWRYHAHLDIAVMLANGANDYQAARKHLAAILEADSLPTGLSSKAGALDHVYKIKHGKVSTE